MNIAFDLDGVLTDFVTFEKERAPKFAEENGLVFCENTNYHQPILYAKTEDALRSDSKSAVQEREYWHKKFWQIYSAEYRSIQIPDNIVNAINGLQYAGHKVFFVSARSNDDWELYSDASLDALNWLTSNDIHFSGLVCTQHGDKNPWLKRWNINIILEDAPEAVSDIAACELVLINRPYNADIANIKRVSSVEEFCRTF